MFADLWIPCLSPQPVSLLFISPQNLYSLEWNWSVKEDKKKSWQVLTSRSDSLEETEDRDSKRHLATEKEVNPQTNWRKWLPQTERGTLTVHWKHLATELATRRLLLSYSGAGSTELSPKPAGLNEGFGRRNQDLLAQKAGVTPPGRLLVLWQYIRRHLAAESDETPQAGWRYLASTLGTRDSETQKVTSPDGPEVLWQYIGSTWQQNLLPGDCCSPAQVQDQLSSVQNQQVPTKDLADEIRTYWHKRQV